MFRYVTNIHILIRILSLMLIPNILMCWDSRYSPVKCVHRKNKTQSN